MTFAVYRVSATMPPGGAVFDGVAPSIQRAILPWGQVPRHAVLRAGLALAVKAVSDGLGWVRLGSINDVLHPCGGHPLSFCRVEARSHLRYRPAVAHAGWPGKYAKLSSQFGGKLAERHQQTERRVCENQLASSPVGKQGVYGEVAGYPDRCKARIPCCLRYRSLAAVRKDVCWAQDRGVQRHVGRQPVCYLPSGVIGRVPFIIGVYIRSAFYFSHFCFSK